MNFTESFEAARQRPGSGGSRRRRAPRPGPAALLLLLLSLLPLPAAAAPLPDSSGEAGLEEEAGARRALPECESLAWMLHDRAVQLQDEVGTGPRRGPRGPSPGLGRDGSSRCLSADVREVHGLEFVQEAFASEKQTVKSLCYSTKHLASKIRQMVINPNEVVIPDLAAQKSLLAKLKSDKAWIEKITTHLILRDFTSFMEKTVRAIRYLKNTRSFSA